MEKDKAIDSKGQSQDKQISASNSKELKPLHARKSLKATSPLKEEVVPTVSRSASEAGWKNNVKHAHGNSIGAAGKLISIGALKDESVTTAPAGSRKRNSIASVNSAIYELKPVKRDSIVVSTRRPSRQLNPNELKRLAAAMTVPAVPAMPMLNIPKGGYLSGGNRALSRTQLSYLSKIKSSNPDISNSVNSRRNSRGKQVLHRILNTQIISHYVVFAILALMMVVVMGQDHTGYLDPFMARIFALFISSCAAALEFGRLAYYIDNQSVIPFYISGTPFFILILFSSNKNDMYHLVFYSLWHFSSYFGAAAMLKAAHHCSVTDFVCLSNRTNLTSALSLVYPFSWAREVASVVSCFITTICCVRLSIFVKINAAAVMSLESYLQSLTEANNDLYRQLRRFNQTKENGLDLVAPIVKVTNTLQEVKQGPNISAELAELIDKAIKILSSNQIYRPKMTADSNVDTDVQVWLKDVLRTGDAENEKQDLQYNQANLESSERPTSLIPEPTTETLDAAHLYLLNIENFSFDILHLQTLVPGRTLRVVASSLLKQHALFKKLSIDQQKFENWSAKIEAGYLPTNSYHNSLHAADVMVMMNYLLSRPRFRGKYSANDGINSSSESTHHSGQTSSNKNSDVYIANLSSGRMPQGSGSVETNYKYSSEEILSALLAAMIHDFKHPGLNNNFLVTTMNPIALRYNDHAVLENFHAASGFEHLHEDSCNFLSALSNDSRKNIRELIIQMVLATDMSTHFEFIGKFKNKMISPTGFEWEKSADRKLVLNMTMKVSDINNAAKPLDKSTKWVSMYVEEVYRQGDQEKRLGIPVSTFMDRNAPDIPKSQVVFIDFLIIPLYEPWIEFVGQDIAFLMDNILENRFHWLKQSSMPKNMVPDANQVHNTESAATNLLPVDEGTTSPSNIPEQASKQI